MNLISQKPTFPNSNSTRNQVDEEHFVDVLPPNHYYLLFYYDMQLKYWKEGKIDFFLSTIKRICCPLSPIPWTVLSTVLPLAYLAYSGGQKCWDLFSDISKSSDLSPFTPNKVEFFQMGGKYCFFFGHNIAGVGGGGSGAKTRWAQSWSKKLSLRAES